MILSLPILQDEQNPYSDNLLYDLEVWDNSGVVSFQVGKKQFQFDNSILHLLYKISEKEQLKHYRELKLDNLVGD
jgi:hypothetical protein